MEEEILKALYETDLSMQENEKLLAEYKTRLSRECTVNDATLRKLKEEVNTLKTSVDQCDFKIHQISSSNYEALLKKVEAIEKHMISSTDTWDHCGDTGDNTGSLKNKLKMLGKEVSHIVEKQTEIAQQLTHIKEAISSKLDNVTLMRKYIGETEELQAELIEQMMEKDCLMVDYSQALKHLKRLKEQYSESKRKNKQLQEDLLKVKNQELQSKFYQEKQFQTIIDENTQLRTEYISPENVMKLQLKKDKEKEEAMGTLEHSIKYLKQEMRNKESIMKLLQHENDTYRRKQRQLTKSCCKLKKIRGKYKKVKYQLNESLDNETRVETELSVLKISHCDEMNSQLQALSSAIDGLVLIFGASVSVIDQDSTIPTVPPSTNAARQSQVTTDYTVLVQLLLEKINYIGKMLSQLTSEKCNVEKRLFEAKHQVKIMKEKLKEFKEDFIH